MDAVSRRWTPRKKLTPVIGYVAILGAFVFVSTARAEESTSSASHVPRAEGRTTTTSTSPNENGETEAIVWQNGRRTRRISKHVVLEKVDETGVVEHVPVILSKEVIANETEPFRVVPQLWRMAHTLGAADESTDSLNTRSSSSPIAASGHPNPVRSEVDVDRSSLGIEPSETIVVRGGKALGVGKPVMAEKLTLAGTRRVSSRPVKKPPVSNLNLQLVSGQAGLRLPSPRRGSEGSQEVLPELKEAPTPKEPTVSKERREHVRRIIQRIRPNADADTVDIWIEQFASLPDGNIEFLVSQSSLLKGASSLPSILGDSSESSSDHSESDSTLTPDDLMIQPAAMTGTAKSHSIVSRNLANAMTVGYREELEIRAASASVASGLKRFAVFHHGTGTTVVTGSPLHLAIQTSGAVFFQLEDGRLTRNGMFSRLSDGRIGITEGSSVVALKDSPIVTTQAAVEIRPDGTVLEAGKRIGRIAIAMVQQPELLVSTDGVYFRTDADVVTATEVELQSGALELSNVDVPRNRYLQFAQRP